MTTILETLQGVSAYPVPLRTLDGVATDRGLTLTAETTQEVLRGQAYNLALADLLLWLSYAPDIAQGGQSYSFSDEQRTQFRIRARGLYKEFGEGSVATRPIYGYKGDRL